MNFEIINIKFNLYKEVSMVIRVNKDLDRRFNHAIQTNLRLYLVPPGEPPLEKILHSIKLILSFVTFLFYIMH